MSPARSEPDPAVLRMAAPLVVSFWMRAAFTFVDTAYAATIGDAAVAAIGLTVPFEFLMIALWVGMSTGLTSGLSRAMGARQARRIEQYLEAGWKLVLGIVPVFLLTGVGIWFWAPRMGLAPEVERAFQVYGSVLVAGSALTAFWSVIPDSLVKAHQDTRSTMWAGILSNVINVTLNTIFLFVFHWGVFGIALSTVLGRFGGLSYALARARTHERTRMAQWVTGIDRSDDPAPYRSIFSLAVPAALNFGLMSVETAAANALLAGAPDSTPAIAAYSIYYRVSLFMVNPVIAIGVAMLPYAARRYGRADLEGIRRGLREAAAGALAYTFFFVTPVMWALGPAIASWLAEAPETARYAAFGLRLVPVACLVAVPFLLCRPVFEGLQRGRPGLVMAILRYGLLALPLAWTGIAVARRMGAPPIEGLILGLLAAGAIASVIFAAWLATVLRRMGREAIGGEPAPRPG
ncbi:MAG: MATE family efflux transporter [Acidobacteria bacterium]|nr:MAG: MATE family efflux transporter [Acidobacteriota bacterium]